jgi:3-methyladenine DNA glycosylase AlkD
MAELEQIRAKLFSLKDETRAEHSKRYLKSPYNFYGNKVPDVKAVAKELKTMDFYPALNLFDELWTSGTHEEMWVALSLLSNHVKKNPIEVWEFMIKRIDKARTWDLVDEMSSHILGPILAERIDLMREIKTLSESRNPWIRRISVVSNISSIKKNKIDLTLRLAEKLVYDEDMYVQKGVGWMLREVGKKNRAALRDFIMMHLDMKPYAFSYATEKIIELRPIRKEFIKKQKEKIKEEKTKARQELKDKFENKNDRH